MNTKARAYLVGAGIAYLASAAFMIHDGGLPGENISILGAAYILRGSLDGAGDSLLGYSIRDGRILTTDNYEIPSLNHAGKSCMQAGSASTFGLTEDYAVIFRTRTILIPIGGRLYPHLAT
jgi:oleate hydratase